MKTNIQSRRIKNIHVPSPRKEAEYHKKQLLRTRSRIDKQVANPNEAVKGRDTIKKWGNKLDGFAYFTQKSTIQELAMELAIEVGPIEEMQAILRGESVDLKKVRSFCDAWKAAEKSGSIQAHSWCKELGEYVDGLLGAATRAEFLYSDCNPKDIAGKFNIAEQFGRIVLNPASPTGWGKGGVSLAIQKGLNQKEFKQAQQAAYAGYTDEVGHANVADAFVVPISGAMKILGGNDKSAPEAVISIRGPNRNAWYVLGGKVKLRQLFQGKTASKRQEQKLRACYASFFQGVLKYNRGREGLEQNPIHDLSLVPISAGIFGYPQKDAGRIMVEMGLDFLARHPEYKINFLANGEKIDGDPKSTALRDSISAATTAFGVPSEFSRGRESEIDKAKINLDNYTAAVANFSAVGKVDLDKIAKIVTNNFSEVLREFRAGHNGTKFQLSRIFRGLAAATRGIDKILDNEMLIELAEGNNSLKAIVKFGALIDNNRDCIDWMGSAHYANNVVLDADQVEKLKGFIREAQQLSEEVIGSRKWERAHVDLVFSEDNENFQQCEKRVRALFPLKGSEHSNSASN